MESLPLELHSLIAELVCDSPFGRDSIRSLSLTNSHFRAIAAPLLFHTLVILTQEDLFRALWQLEPSKYTPRKYTRRLFIGPSISLTEPAFILHLLRLIAPDLRDLVAILPSPSTSSALLGAIFRIRFPHLKSLTVDGFYPLPRPGFFPALTHLHLAGNCSPIGLTAALSLACPKLTRFRVSGLKGAPAFASELSGALKENAGDSFLQRLDSVSQDQVAALKDAQMRWTLATLEQAVEIKRHEAEEKGKSFPQVEFSEEKEKGLDVNAVKAAWLAMGCP
ncbi:hypothetical protein R3P38DRAFT_2951055 [Favolaschia claudopus]|uniref:F-box domain-containing protein n=1 Tax=Favolaschia claudopus TaxID=2862362 RepID=A0AAW0BF65_9AGAR